MNVFIDTNVLFSFYNLLNERIEEVVNQIIFLNKNRRIKLWTTEQVKNEYIRNRDSVITQMIKTFRDEKFNNQIPQIVKHTKKYQELSQVIKDYEQIKNSILSELETEISNSTLKADAITLELLKAANLIDTTPELLTIAKDRYDLGNPPGKNNSYGDALNWECLISSLPQSEDLHIVTDDSDYYSVLKNDAPNSFLSLEWSTKKKAKLHIYKRISQFISANFSEAKNIVDFEISLLIDDLRNSGCFQQTHNVINTLSEIIEFFAIQAEEILHVMLTNQQVKWIINDDDVSKLAHKLIEVHRDNINKIDDKIISRVEMLFTED